MKFKSATMFIIALAFAGILLQDWMHPIPGRAEEYRLGTVTTNVNLRKTPGLKGDIVAGLQKGLPVKVYGEKDGWYRVSAKKNYIQFNGWVYKRYVEIVSLETPGALPKLHACHPCRPAGSQYHLQNPYRHLPHQPQWSATSRRRRQCPPKRQPRQVSKASPPRQVNRKRPPPNRTGRLLKSTLRQL